VCGQILHKCTRELHIVWLFALAVAQLMLSVPVSFYGLHFLSVLGAYEATMDAFNRHNCSRQLFCSSLYCLD
jgi:hypothetical protein